MNFSDEKFMKLAIEIAESSIDSGEFSPFGAVIIKNSKIISSAYNTVHTSKHPTAHAEINALRKACLNLKTNDLTGAELYTTCEPCPMCFSAIWWAKISRLVYGVGIADLINFGYNQIDLSCDFLNKRGNSSIIIIERFMRDSCLRLLK